MIALIHFLFWFAILGIFFELLAIMVNRWGPM